MITCCVSVKPLEIRVCPPRGHGCGRGADPGLREVLTGMYRCFSAMLEVLLCRVVAAYSPKKVVSYTVVWVRKKSDLQEKRKKKICCFCKCLIIREA